MNQPLHKQSAADLTKMAMIAGIYVVVTFITAPIAYGPLNFRIAEGLNFLGLYNKKYIWAITLGVFISNYFAYGALDMIIGSLSTLIFLYLGSGIADWVINRFSQKFPPTWNLMIIKYFILTLIFSLSMITIALMIKLLTPGLPFWPLYGGLVLSEMIAMILGGLIIYPISKRINFYE